MPSPIGSVKYFFNKRCGRNVMYIFTCRLSSFHELSMSAVGVHEFQPYSGVSYAVGLLLLIDYCDNKCTEDQSHSPAPKLNPGTLVISFSVA